MVYIKGLYIVKILGKVGYRVILVDLEDFWCFVVRWLRFIFKFYIVLNLNFEGGKEEYINGMIYIVDVEKVDWYILVSYIKIVVLDIIIK